MNRSDEQRASERAGYELGRQVIDQVRLVADDQAATHRLFVAGLVLAAEQESPQNALAGFGTAICPALHEALGPHEKSLATLAARAALAGHACSVTSDGLIQFSRWGQVVTFGDFAAASVWLDRVTGVRA
jgi:hypothetical protein